jgi:acetyl esterase
MALEPASSELLTQLVSSGLKPIQEMTPAEARGLGATLRGLYGPGPDMARVDELGIPTAHGSIPARVFVPAGESRALIIYLHGGGWVVGSLDEFDTLARQIAARIGATVVLPDYRLAPEHPFPAACDDAHDVLLWVAAHRSELAAADAPLILMGDSAGGNLTCAVTQRVRARGGPAVNLQVLIYPVTDCDLGNASYLAPENQLIVNRDSMAWYWDRYVPDWSARLHPGASPLRGKDFAGLPPAIVLTAEFDPLRDEGEAYAASLEAAGVPVVRRRFTGQMHGFFTIVNILPGAREGLEFVAEQIGEHLSRSAQPGSAAP